MAYDEHLAERIKHVLEEKHVIFEPKKMMGGLTYMVDNKMCVGVSNDRLMARIDPEEYDRALEMENSRIMDFTGKPMRGFLFVEPEGIDRQDDLEYWIQLCLDFNPKAKASKSKKRKK